MDQAIAVKGALPTLKAEGLAVGKAITATALALLWSPSDAERDRDVSRLTQFTSMLRASPEKDTREALRGPDKSKGETLAPVVEEMIDLGLLESTAKQRHSEMRTLFAAYVNGMRIEEFTQGWHATIDAARKVNETKREQQAAIDKRQKQDLLFGQAVANLGYTIANAPVDELIKARELAAEQYAEIVLDETQEAHEKRAGNVVKKHGKAYAEAFALALLAECGVEINVDAANEA